MATDSLFASVTSLVHFDGTHGSTTITDFIGGTWTASGGPTISTTQSKWGGSSVRMTGAGTVTGPNPATAFGTNNFCMEFWAWADSGNIVSRSLYSTGTGAGQFELWINSNGALALYGDSGALSITGGTNNLVVADAWNHVALTRNGNVWTIWFNGVSQGSLTLSITMSSTVAWGLGTAGTLGAWVGYFDDFRVTVGDARYTANFTAPTAAYGHSVLGDGGIMICPTPVVTGSGSAIIPTAVCEAVMPGMLVTGYGGANGSASMAMPTVSMVTGGNGAATMPMPYTISVGHAATGDVAFVASMPSAQSIGYGGANGAAIAPTMTASGTATVTGWGKGAAVCPSMTATGTGTVSSVASGSPFAGMPMARVIGYGGALHSVTLTGGFTTLATGTTGAVGNGAAVMPLFEVTGTGTAQNYGNGLAIMPAIVALVRGNGYATLSGFTLTAIGTAVVTATYEAYALNLNHSAEGPDELTRYTNYPFTHTVRDKNSYFGAAADGLYLLEGTTDDGTDIAFDVKTHKTDFDTAQKKSIIDAFIGGRMGASATITLHVGETSSEAYAYTTPRGSTAQNYRQQFGKGIKNRYYAFEIAGSGALSVDTITFNIATLARKV